MCGGACDGDGRCGSGFLRPCAPENSTAVGSQPSMCMSS